MNTFKERYSMARAELKKELGLKSLEAVPRISRVSVSVGAGHAVGDPNYIEQVSRELALITGQKPIIRKAKKSIAGFKLREGTPVGLLVTLRGKRMYDFLNKLVNVALPRVRDFQGISAKSFDGHGNYTLGIGEHVVFPEVVLDNVEKTFGLSVVIGTTAQSDAVAKQLLEKLNFPFRDNDE
ncbi:50S ribosomal protein L5 [candidate division Kazan bacterium RBG_13_50_9]|uniref:Large ribosomal subunit protein uL5 n=1 Tax=candidate division Kazan bacterium RBG_13_50_9 TaxID=1798535 RepID=A0A1F4NSH9_UNCK3|nr:MAG: 50S ribosomal protein L5 [candidate division Kazan bacterium RBG_13_50_9]